jgi:uncharacterized protein (TIGR02444 family)
MPQIDVYKGVASPFWTFSLAVYGRAGVPPACLTLQDRGGADVNVVLFCLFLGRSGRMIAAQTAGAIAGTIEPWRAEVVVVLRTARRALKEPPADFGGPAVDHLRKNVKAAELEAERIQQEALFVAFPAATTGLAEADLVRACTHNVDAYQRHLGATFDADALAVLLDAAGQTEVKGATK